MAGKSPTTADEAQDKDLWRIAIVQGAVKKASGGAIAAICRIRWKTEMEDGIDVCVTLMYGLIENHPFYDANKRTAFLTSVLHLQKIGRRRQSKISNMKISRSRLQITDCTTFR